MIERLGLDAEALKLRRLRVHLGVARDRVGPRAPRLDHARSMLSNTCYGTDIGGCRAVQGRR